MNLNFDKSLINQYKGQSQIIRVLSEDWVKQNSFCPNCGNNNLHNFNNNKPVADFLCFNCKQEFELKSKNGNLGNKIVDGAYSTMINRIESKNNPNFFFLTYDKAQLRVKDFLIIPKYFFISNLIEKRKPLSETARRKGWVGCNIILKQIPISGRIFLVKNSEFIKKEEILQRWKETSFLNNISQKNKGWLIDVLNCIDSIPNEEFRLEDIYKFETKLKLKYPNNNFIKDKIRQQLQLLRDAGRIDFISRGIYKKRL